MPFDILAAAEQVAADYADRTDPASPRYQPFTAKILERHPRQCGPADVLTAEERTELAIRALLED